MSFEISWRKKGQPIGLFDCIYLLIFWQYATLHFYLSLHYHLIFFYTEMCPSHHTISSLQWCYLSIMASQITCISKMLHWLVQAGIKNNTSRQGSTLTRARVPGAHKFCGRARELLNSCAQPGKCFFRTVKQLAAMSLVVCPLAVLLKQRQSPSQSVHMSFIMGLATVATHLSSPFPPGVLV